MKKLFSLLAFAVIAGMAVSVSLAAERATVSRFRDLNGVMWYYTTYNEYRFKDIEASLDELKGRGIRVLGIYAPYHGDARKWHGCDPLDFYKPPPQNGTIEDWKDLVAAAHVRDMKVISYFVNIYMDSNSEFFRTAEGQYADGIRDAREVATFRWAEYEFGEQLEKPLPLPAAGPSTWRYSSRAGAYYWSLWGEAGLDFNLPGARAEIERLENFWLDTGLDGFMWDVGSINDKFRHSMVELPASRNGGDMWITFESTEGELGPDYDRFGLTAWFNHADEDLENDYSLIALGERSADELEEALGRSDFARSRGKTTYAWTLSPDDSTAAYRSNPRLYVQEAALLAGAGIIYGHSNYERYRKWDAELRSAWDRVLVTVNAHEALRPTASRTRVPAGKDPKVYAMRRTSEDGGQTALLVYNFNDSPATISLDLTDTGISPRQVPLDLYEKSPAPKIEGPRYTLTLPAYGFRLLQVAAISP